MNSNLFSIKFISKFSAFYLQVQRWWVKTTHLAELVPVAPPAPPYQPPSTVVSPRGKENSQSSM